MFEIRCEVDFRSPPMEIKNPISFLKELCDKHYLPHPEYREVDAVGPPNERWFTVGCTFSQKEFIGTGARKQTAKTESAKMALQWFGQKDQESTAVCPLNDCCTNVGSLEQHMESFHHISRSAIARLIKDGRTGSAREETRPC